MTRTVWAPEISAAMNVHYRVKAAIWEEKVTAPSREAQNRKKMYLVFAGT